jgi:NAD(P)-dependent dehydrogenase (short-subunit alcohol dehydrogenase family)
MKQLTNKKALITGASRGLGKEIALAFARENIEAISITARNKTELNKVCYEINKISPTTKVVVLAGDVSVSEDIERIVATTLHAFEGKLDILINNASVLGITPRPYLLDCPLDNFRKILDTNLVGPFLLIKSLLPAMIEEGGSIINVSSDAGVVGYAGWGPYGISKFGLEGMSQTWAAELKETDVRINWVDPGSMNTAMHRAAEPDENPDQWADPADITDVFVFLASDQSKQINGQRFEAQEDWKETIKSGIHA